MSEEELAERLERENHAARGLPIMSVLVERAVLGAS